MCFCVLFIWRSLHFFSKSFLFVFCVMYICCVQLYIDLVRSLQWNKFTLLYEDDAGLLRLSHLLKTFSPVTVRRLDAKRNYRALLQEMQETGENNFVVDCMAGALPHILEQAQQVGLITPRHSYLFTSLVSYRLLVVKKKLDQTGSYIFTCV